MKIYTLADVMGYGQSIQRSFGDNHGMPIPKLPIYFQSTNSTLLLWVVSVCPLGAMLFKN